VQHKVLHHEHLINQQCNYWQHNVFKTAFEKTQSTYVLWPIGQGGVSESKNGMIWGQKGQWVQKQGRMGSMHPKMGHVMPRRAGGESGKVILGQRA